MHDGMPYGRNQGQGHSREVDRQSPTGLIFIIIIIIRCPLCCLKSNVKSLKAVCHQTTTPLALRGGAGPQSSKAFGTLLYGDIFSPRASKFGMVTYPGMAPGAGF